MHRTLPIPPQPPVTVTVGGRACRPDVTATRAYYARFGVGSASVCRCIYCRNYVAQRQDEAFEELHKVCGWLGIDAEKEADLEWREQHDGTHLYSGYYLFAGELDSALTTWDEGYEAAELQVVDGVGYTEFPVAFAGPRLALTFLKRLPWRLETPAPSLDGEDR